MKQGWFIVSVSNPLLFFCNYRGKDQWAIKPDNKLHPTGAYKYSSVEECKQGIELDFIGRKVPILAKPLLLEM